MKKLFSLIDTMVEEVVGKKEIENIQKTTLKNSGIVESEMIQTDIATLDLEQVNQLLKDIETKKVFLVQKRKSMLSEMIFQNEETFKEKIKQDKKMKTLINHLGFLLHKNQTFLLKKYEEELVEYYQTKSKGEQKLLTHALIELFYLLENEMLVKFVSSLTKDSEINESFGESDELFTLFQKMNEELKQKEIS